jgi:hypothetical protein
MELWEEMLDSPNVIEVSVREEDSPNELLLAFEKRNIGDEVIDPEHILFGELESEIDNEEVGSDLHDHAVSAYFLKPSKRDNAHDRRLRAVLCVHEYFLKG